MSCHFSHRTRTAHRKAQPKLLQRTLSRINSSSSLEGLHTMCRYTNATDRRPSTQLGRHCIPVSLGAKAHSSRWLTNLQWLRTRCRGPRRRRCPTAHGLLPLTPGITPSHSMYFISSIAWFVPIDMKVEKSSLRTVGYSAQRTPPRRKLHPNACLPYSALYWRHSTSIDVLGGYH